MKRITLILLAAASLSACDSEPTRDVQFYLDNKEERTVKLTECLNNPGEKSHTPNCKNALAAEQKALMQGTGMPTIK
ncbi:EexN family lipoprotein [Denitromonas sp.]|jgi:hypothetical protein|uniref:EexN family lipoprotein n=1 Tax=Denitromonas sp. TaxID=2734609 RepID=UPI002AFEDD9E|nr:EexN family lipoprotein [Denitromonas sp.]